MDHANAHRGLWIHFCGTSANLRRWSARGIQLEQNFWYLAGGTPVTARDEWKVRVGPAQYLACNLQGLGMT